VASIAELFAVLHQNTTPMATTLNTWSDGNITRSAVSWRDGTSIISVFCNHIRISKV